MPAGSIEWGSVADWFSGIASLAAVITALYLARASNRIRLDLHVGPRLVIGQGQPTQEIVSLGATNIGTRTTVVTQIGIRTGRFRKRYALINITRGQWSEGLPVTLIDGARCTWGIALDDQKSWLKELLTKELVRTKDDVRTLEFSFATSNGGIFHTAAEKSLKEMIEVLRAEKKSA